MPKIKSAFWLFRKYFHESIKAKKDGLINKNNNWLDTLLDFPYWFISQQKTNKLVLHAQPWLPYSVVRKICKYQLQNSKLFEYGAGASTIYFLQQGCEVVSVEHDKEWFDIVAQKVAKQGYKNWQGFLCPPEASNFIVNETFKSQLEQYENKSFQNYVNKILDFPDNFFDIVLIDGRARNGCFQVALPKVKIGGIIIWDNVERSKYKLNQIMNDNRFQIEVIGGATPGVNFFTRTAFITKL